MLASAVIVFREILEAALVVAVILGATRGLRGRRAWIGGGVAAGAAGALAVAALMGRISESLSGAGQPVFEAAVLLSATAMLGWHNVWMARHGRRMSEELQRLGRDVELGRRSLAALFAAAAIAVMREGSEIALFLYGVAASGADRASIAAGGLLGLAAGAAAGWALYKGLTKIPTRHFFRATSWMLLLLAAGMASQAAAFLNQADLLPSLGDRLWDTSWLLPADGLIGAALKTLIGYTPAPSGLQLLFYTATLALIGGLMSRGRAKDGPPKTSARRRTAVAAALALAAAFRGKVHAETSLDAESLNIYSPQITQGEREVESILFATKSRQQGAAFSVGYSPTAHWAAEVYEVYHRDPGGPTLPDAVEVENRFSFGEPGQYWADFGAIAEFEIPQQTGDHGVAQLAPIVEKQFGPAVFSLNLPVQWQYGSSYSPGTGVGYAARAEYLLSPWASPALELFGLPDSSGAMAGMSQEGHMAGPALYGRAPAGSWGTLRYSLAPLAGLTPSSPAWTVIARLECEF